MNCLSKLSTLTGSKSENQENRKNNECKMGYLGKREPLRSEVESNQGLLTFKTGTLTVGKHPTPKTVASPNSIKHPIG